MIECQGTIRTTREQGQQVLRCDQCAAWHSCGEGQICGEMWEGPSRTTIATIVAVGIALVTALVIAVW